MKIKKNLALLIFYRRMFAEYEKCFSQVYTAFAVEIESFDGGASGWCFSDYQSEILVPSEMFVPNLFSRMKKRGFFSRDRSCPVVCVNLCPLQP